MAVETTDVHNEKFKTYRTENDVSNRPTGRDVWRWPEFQAFAKRLGIDTSKPNTSLSITLEMDECVKIHETYLSSDTSGE